MAKGVMVVNGRRIEWRGDNLCRYGDLLEVPGNHLAPTDGRLHNQSRVGLDGHAQLVQYLRVQMTMGTQKGAGPFDGWVVDTTTGFRAAWRGMGAPISNGWTPTLWFPNGYRISCNLHGLMAGPELVEGEVVLDALPPRSLPRRLRRAEMAGGRVWCGLLIYGSREQAQWPPQERDRTKRGHQPTQAWDVPGHGKKRDYYD